MIIPDINLLLYAYDAASSFHAKAAAWWQGCLSGTEPIGLLPVVAFGFVRIGTSTRAFQNPMTPSEAAGHVRSWLEQPPVELLEPHPGHVERVLKLLEDLGTAGNLVTDAQLAVAALDHDAVLHTTDTDFIRFGTLRWFNPVTGVGSASQRRTKGS
ncbi:MAG: PIN domain-containing protein [Verrucomicrobia bacterium]|nr:PIN domain-containing protein [Verrucomicrobiota bacterium]